MFIRHFQLAVIAVQIVTTCIVTTPTVNAQDTDSIYQEKMAAPGVRMVPVVGGKYHVWTQKVGDGQIKILLLHGRPGTSPEYFENFPGHLPKSYEIYFYSQLGTYFSNKQDDSTLQTVQRAVEEVEEVRKGLGLDQFFLLGHSWGSLLAQAYAAKYQQHLKGLILCNASIFATGENQDYQGLLIADIVDSMPEYHQYADSIRYGLVDNNSNGEKFGEIMAKAMPLFIAQHYCRLGALPDTLMLSKKHSTGRSLGWLTQDMNSTDFKLMTAAIKVPTLFIGSKYDYIPPYDYARMKKLMIQNSSVDIYICPNGSHFDMWDDPEHFFGAIQDFVTKVERK